MYLNVYYWSPDKEKSKQLDKRSLIIFQVIRSPMYIDHHQERGWIWSNDEKKVNIGSNGHQSYGNGSLIKYALITKYTSIQLSDIGEGEVNWSFKYMITNHIPNYH